LLLSMCRRFSQSKMRASGHTVGGGSSAARNALGRARSQRDPVGGTALAGCSIRYLASRTGLARSPAAEAPT
jgi:uncharacterized membrane protein